MPLYSKVEKRLAKRAKDEASGLAELKAAVREELGEGSSSSGSSASGSDSERDSEDELDEDERESGDGVQEVDEDEIEDEDDDGDSDDEDSPNVPGAASAKRKRDHATDDEKDDDGDDGESGSELDESGEESDDDFDMTIEQVSAEPIYTTTSTQGAEVDTCVLCPGKVLKNATMVGVHKESNSHRRAVKRWERYLVDHSDEISDDTDPRAIVQDMLDSISTQLEKHEKPKRSKEVLSPSGKKPRSKAEKLKARKEKIQKKLADKVRDVQQTGDVSGLNRKARRLLAQQQHEKAKAK